MCDRGLPPALAPGLISRPTRSRKLSEFPNNPLVREASVCDLRGSSVFEQAPNLLGKSRRAGEGEEGGLGLCPEWGRLLLVALIAEACSLRLAGFGCLAVNKKKKKKSWILPEPLFPCQDHWWFPEEEWRERKAFVDGF